MWKLCGESFLIRFLREIDEESIKWGDYKWRFEEFLKKCEIFEEKYWKHGWGVLNCFKIWLHFLWTAPRISLVVTL